MLESSTAPIAGYSHARELYRSSSTVIVRATRLRDELPIVLKYSAREYPALREEAARRNEHDLLEALRSPHIIRSHGLARARNRLVLIEEYFPGVPLDAYVQRHALSIDAVIALAITLADALAAVHAAGILHKDLSPANILIDPHDRAIKLIDFDLASRLVGERHDLRSLEVLQGTLGYISPEQTGRVNRTVDVRSDLYSLGATLYHLLAQRPPFEESSPLELVHAHIAREPRALRELDPGIPAPLIAIVEKLMAKSPEARYQSALGLGHDLQRLAARGTQLDSPGFVLGERDVSTRFEIPQHLYGRELYIEAMVNGFARVSHGHTELLLIGGYSGIGKSSLVREVHRPIVKRRGYFASGKFDQFNRATPYSAIGQAFGQLIETLFSESPERVAAWRAQILELAGPNGRMLTDVIPALEALIGSQPPLAGLSSTDVQGRFSILLQRFVRLFARPEHPLVLSLDDLQWADNPSLQFLEVLLGEARTPYLYVITAYRDNEVDAGHPFLIAVENIKAAGTTTRELMVPPLTAGEAGDMIAHTLRRTPAQVQPLAELLYEKTGGNPFFLIQLLQVLHDTELLHVDPATGSWSWELEPILRVGTTSNIVDVMTARLGRLPRKCSTVLQVAACIGGTFDLKTLAQVCDLPYHVAANELWPALSEGLILCGSTDYQAAGDDPISAGDPRAAIRAELHRQLRDEIDAGRFNVRYRFLHDRVQQAAYLLTPDFSRCERHLRIGRQLLRGCTTEAQRDELIFELTSHLNRGRELLSDPAEEREIAALNLRAGMRAKTSAAYPAAVRHLTMALDLLGPNAWGEAPALAFEVHKHLADCYYLVGDPRESTHHSAQAIAHAPTVLDRAELYVTRVQLLITGSELAAAAQAGIEGLALIGFHIPADPASQAELYGDARVRLDQRLAGCDVATLIDHAVLTDRTQLIALELLVHTWSAAAFARMRAVSDLASTWLVLVSLDHGNAAASAMGYMLHGIRLATEGELRRGFELGALGIRLNQERFPSAVYAVRVCNMFAHSLNPYFHHLETCLPHYMTSYRVGPQVGDILYSSRAILFAILVRTGKGDNLAEVDTESTKYLQFLRDIKDPNILAVYEMHRQMIACLRDRTPVLGTLDSEQFDEVERVARLSRSKFQQGMQWYGWVRTWLHLVFGQDAEALALADRIEQIDAYDINIWTQTYHCFFHTLAIFQAYPTLSAERRAGYAPLIARNLARFARWSETAAVNFAHRLELLRAEQARLDGRAAEASAHYDRSIELAASGGFTHDEALALELAGRFYRGHGRARIARVYLTDAYYAYARWGAAAKTRIMVRDYADLLLIERDPVGEADPARELRSTQVGSQGLDLATVLKANQAISSEIVADKLFTRVMSILTENAGAERGVLLLERDGRLMIEVEASAAGAVLVRRPLADESEIAAGVIQLANGTRKSLVLDDAQGDPRFLRDPYVMRGRPRSVLCLPIVHQGRNHGVVYFENNLACGVFTTDRLAILELLISQAAISIENAMVYGELEQRVAERTEALRQSLSELTLTQVGLETANQALRKEIDERHHVESELRLAQKLEAVGRLAAGIAHEINTPIQFIQDHVSFVRDGTQDLLQAIGSYRGLQALARTDATPELVAKLDQLDAETDLAFLSDRMPEALEQALYGLGRVATLVRSMKDFAHTDRPDKHPSDINRALTATLAIAHNEYKYIADVRTHLGELPPVLCHISELNQCFLNLIVNASHAIADAVAHSDRRGVIEVTSRIEGEMLVVSISDTGTGVPLEIRDKLFDPFFTTKPIGQGTGQGLAIARRVIDKHGGSLSFETELGRGTTFHVRLPIDGGASVTAA